MTVSAHPFPNPVQCVLWHDPARVRGNLQDRFDIIDTFEDDTHLIRRLLKCRECGQLYFYEMSEEVDWKDGDDPQYRKYIPVSSMGELEMLKKASASELQQVSPCLRSDFPKEAAEPLIYWVRGNHQTGTVAPSVSIRPP
jgi:hypothetical protein